MTGRDRRIAGLAPWVSARPRYQLKLGPTAIPFDVLTDEALAALRARIARDMRSERRRHATTLAQPRASPG